MFDFLHTAEKKGEKRPDPLGFSCSGRLGLRSVILGQAYLAVIQQMGWKPNYIHTIPFS